MSSLQPIQYCRSNGTDQHSWTASDGTRYESCYNWKGPNGSEGSGNAVGRNSNGTCNYPSQATHAYCVPTASNTTCPDGFESSNGACKGTAYGHDGTHNFSTYDNIQKAEWACNAGLTGKNNKNVTWKAVYDAIGQTQPSGKTQWDSKSASCAVASNTTCPDGFKSSNGACKGRAYGIAENDTGDLDNGSHGFSTYDNIQKAEWACNAGLSGKDNKNVTWKAVYDAIGQTQPSGKTWWIGDENGGYCTNNKVEILTKGKCGVYGQIIDMTSPQAQNKSWYECRSAKGFTKYNPYNFKPGDKDAIASQILANIDFETRRCWFSDDNWPHEKATYEGKSSDKHELKIKARCHFPEFYENFAYCRSNPKAEDGAKGYHNKDGNREWFNADMTLKLSDDWLAKKVDPTNNIGGNRPFWDWQTQTAKCYKKQYAWVKNKPDRCQECSFKYNNNLGMHVSKDLKLDKIHENCNQKLESGDFFCFEADKSPDEQLNNYEDYLQTRIRIEMSGHTEK